MPARCARSRIIARGSLVSTSSRRKPTSIDWMPERTFSPCSPEAASSVSESARSSSGSGLAGMGGRGAKAAGSGLKNRAENRGENGTHDRSAPQGFTIVK